MRASVPLLTSYRIVAQNLLASHKLVVPDTTVRMLAHTIMTCRELAPRLKKTKGRELTSRERLQIALKHARKLLEYSKRRPSHRDSISNRKLKLLLALNSLGVTIWLAIAAPGVDIGDLLGRLRRDELDAGELALLVHAIDVARAGSSRSGGPIAENTKIVRAGCIAWLRPGSTRPYRWNEAKLRLTGPLPAFVRELLACCDGSHALVRALGRGLRERERALSMKDAALHLALKRALAYIRKNHAHVVGTVA